MGHVMMNFRNDNLCRFMTKEEMHAKAPYIFSKTPTNPGVSERYVMADTETIIDDFEKLGWGVVECKQQRANKRSNIRSFHMVALQNPNVFITKEGNNGAEEVDCYPRIILQSSHDGFHSFKFMVGMFRCICENGLVIATEQFESISVRHINYDFEELRRIVATAIENIKEQVLIMNEMKGTELSDKQKKEFAIAALKIRKGMKDDDKLTISDKEVMDILKPLRTEDEGNDVWSVFNVLQEKMIKGIFNFGITKKGKHRKARPITGAAKDIEVNQNLFKKALSYRIAV